MLEYKIDVPDTHLTGFRPVPISLVFMFLARYCPGEVSKITLSTPCHNCHCRGPPCHEIPKLPRYCHPNEQGKDGKYKGRKCDRFHSPVSAENTGIHDFGTSLCTEFRYIFEIICTLFSKPLFALDDKVPK